MNEKEKKKKEKATPDQKARPGRVEDTPPIPIVPDTTTRNGFLRAQGNILMGPHVIGTQVRPP